MVTLDMAIAMEDMATVTKTMATITPIPITVTKDVGIKTWNFRICLQLKMKIR
jgi:hypothetical protein